MNYKIWHKAAKEMYKVTKINIDTNIVSYIDAGLTFEISLKFCILLRGIGIEDKNKKEIYAGDIIKYLDNNRTRNEETSNKKAIIIDYSYETTARIYPDEEDNENTVTTDFNTCVEVLGNIYENPELLEINKGIYNFQ